MSNKTSGKKKWVDFKFLKARVTMFDILQHYNLLSEFKEGKNKLTGPCPIHNGTNKKQFTVNLLKNVFYCFSCKSGGNILNFVSLMERVTIRDAAILICEWFNLHFDKDDTTPSVKTKPKIQEPDEDEFINPPLKKQLYNLDAKHPYLYERGLTQSAIKHFGIGYCSNGLMNGRIAIPIHDENNVLVAYAGMSIRDESDKYKFPPKFKKSLVVYNLNSITPRQYRELIIVEGFFSVFAFYQAGFENVVALMGASMSEHQEQLIIERADKVVLLFDGDEAGRKCLENCLIRLSPKIDVKEIRLQHGLQPDHLTTSELKTLINEGNYSNNS